MTERLDPAIKLQRAEERMCKCGTAGSGEGHADWCPAEKFDRIPRRPGAQAVTREPCSRCEGAGLVYMMPDGHEIECPQCEGGGGAEAMKAGWEVEGFIDRLTRRNDANSGQLIFEAISHLRAFSRDCDALRDNNRELRAEIERLLVRINDQNIDYKKLKDAHTECLRTINKLRAEIELVSK